MPNAKKCNHCGCEVNQETLRLITVGGSEAFVCPSCWDAIKATEVVPQKEDFSYTVENGTNGSLTVYVKYKGVTVCAFGTHPEGFRKKGHGKKSALVENFEVTVQQILAGLNKRVSKMLPLIDMQQMHERYDWVLTDPDDAQYLRRMRTESEFAQFEGWMVCEIGENRFCVANTIIDLSEFNDSLLRFYGYDSYESLVNECGGSSEAEQLMAEMELEAYALDNLVPERVFSSFNEARNFIESEVER